MNRCVYSEHRGHLCGVLVTDDDLDAVELQDGKGIICGPHVAILLSPRTSKDDPSERHGKKHGGFRWTGK